MTGEQLPSTWSGLERSDMEVMIKIGEADDAPSRLI
jgi:hypothetical protein